ncbi:MAG: YkgJ family cysteine cluster protein [Nanobdellota archaeon]
MPNKSSQTNAERISIQDFTCKRCGECCQYHVLLSDTDIERIGQGGYTDFYEHDNERKVLKRRQGYCIFYNNGCSIYARRPKICRDYPFIHTTTVTSCRPSDDPLLKRYIAFKNLK